MSWRYGAWTVEHALPVGAAMRVSEGAQIRAGDVIASGGTVSRVYLVDGARRVGVSAVDLDRVLRVRPVADVRHGAILARTGRRFARAATSPIDGRLVHVTADGQDQYYYRDHYDRDTEKTPAEKLADNLPSKPRYEGVT